MGFNDEQRNINALIASGGNVGGAIQHLIGPQTSNDKTKHDGNDNNSNKK